MALAYARWTRRCGDRVGCNGMVRLWDPTDGTCIRVLEGHQDEVHAVSAVQAQDRTLLIATTSCESSLQHDQPIP
jgi:hypothetical protein